MWTCRSLPLWVIPERSDGSWPLSGIKRTEVTTYNYNKQKYKMVKILKKAWDIAGFLAQEPVY